MPTPPPAVLRVYLVKGDGPGARWIEIGVARPHKDGEGYALDLDALPLEGRIVLRRKARRQTRSRDDPAGDDR
ncbi:hypothetical protein BZG35_08200 [Brevundimonas sp. LM2]|uniref:hypothetical protein n=1 Tax=Brevundimonas sp. LM2 TaxID=1938605 RepID=UPI000983974D|nr:hypothetical protein [Brevundimonas sp. LM2]AQR61633.1 hypothetical protein BZG35_08200 [Brevundimonas sp. LM2]